MASCPPRLEGNNIIVKIDEKDYEKECMECQYDVIRRILLQKGDRPYSSKELKDKVALL